MWRPNLLSVASFAPSSWSRSLVCKTLLAVPLAYLVTSFASSRRPYFTSIAVAASSVQHKPEKQMEIDPDYPGTAVQRMLNIRDRVRNLTPEELNGDWESVRRRILWAGGLKDIQDAPPGMGYTGHSFNDFNHCDLTAMLAQEADNENEGRVDGIAYRNPLGVGVRIASAEQEELGPGGSWSTCMLGCDREPPQDVAHVQFRSRIAFKLVWVPPDFTRFVLVDDDGHLLNSGAPTGSLPHPAERQQNYLVVRGSKYALAAERLAAVSVQKQQATADRAL